MRVMWVLLLWQRYSICLSSVFMHSTCVHCYKHGRHWHPVKWVTQGYIGSHCTNSKGMSQMQHSRRQCPCRGGMWSFTATASQKSEHLCGALMLTLWKFKELCEYLHTAHTGMYATVSARRIAAERTRRQTSCDLHLCETGNRVADAILCHVSRTVCKPSGSLR